MQYTISINIVFTYIIQALRSKYDMASLSRLLADLNTCLFYGSHFITYLLITGENKTIHRLNTVVKE